MFLRQFCAYVSKHLTRRGRLFRRGRNSCIGDDRHRRGAKNVKYVARASMAWLAVHEIILKLYFPAYMTSHVRHPPLRDISGAMRRDIENNDDGSRQKPREEYGGFPRFIRAGCYCDGKIISLFLLAIIKPVLEIIVVVMHADTFTRAGHGI